MSDVPPVRVHFNAPISPGVSLTLDWDTPWWGLQIGQWYIETIGGDLIIRKPGQPSNATPLLKVPVSA